MSGALLLPPALQLREAPLQAIHLHPDVQAFLEEADLATCAAIDVRAWTSHGLALLAAIHPPIVVPAPGDRPAQDGDPQGRSVGRNLRYLAVANFAALAALQQVARKTDTIPVLCLDASTPRAQIFEVLQASLLGMPALYRTTEGAPAVIHGTWQRLIAAARGFPVRNLLDSDRNASFCAATGFSPQSIGPSARRPRTRSSLEADAPEGSVDAPKSKPAA